MSLAKRYLDEIESRGYVPKDGAICLDEIEDAALGMRLTPVATNIYCKYCDSYKSGVPLDKLLDVVVDTIGYYYEDANQVLPWDNEMDGLTGSLDIDDVLYCLASDAFCSDSAEQIHKDLATAIGHDRSYTPFYSRHSYHADSILFGWEQFENLVKFGTRVLLADSGPDSPSIQIKQFLDEVLPLATGSLNLVRPLPVGTSIYRGRLAEKPSDFEWNASELGPAPKELAKTNRMSPAGVALFYGSSDIETVAAEIARGDTRSIAVIGEFKTTEPLYILDFTAAPVQFSPFSVEYRAANVVGSFLEHFADQISKPVIADGREHIDYAPTQLITEFLRWTPVQYAEGITYPLDGIAWKNPDTEGKSYVVFTDLRGDKYFSTGQNNEPEPPPKLTLAQSGIHAYHITRKYNLRELDQDLAMLQR